LQREGSGVEEDKGRGTRRTRRMGGIREALDPMPYAPFSS